MKKLRNFIGCYDLMPSDFILGLDAGHINTDGTIGGMQQGALETFAVGMPIYSLKGEYLGRLSVGLYDNLNYTERTEEGIKIPVEDWKIEGYKGEYQKILTYYQAKERGFMKHQYQVLKTGRYGHLYKPAEPLIKDEKIRKAVRAWAEANDYGKDEEYQYEDFSTGWKSWSLEHHQNGDDNEIHFNGGIDFRKMNHQGYYTIDELCGEEEE